MVKTGDVLVAQDYFENPCAEVGLVKGRAYTVVEVYKHGGGIGVRLARSDVFADITYSLEWFRPSKNTVLKAYFNAV